LVRLSARIAHDFNNMMTIIRGYCVLALQKMKTDDPARPRLEAIHGVSQQALQITSQLLAFSRRQPLVLQVFDVHMHLQEHSEMIQQLLGDDIKLLCDLGNKELPVYADRHHFDQVIANLALNARDAIKRTGQVHLKLEEKILTDAQARAMELPPGRYIVITFRDTGCGMSPETLDHAFEPFFTTKKGVRGAGFGLSSAYGIIRQNRGEITIDSTPGKGTTIRIYLPRGDKSQPKGAAQRFQPLLPGRKHTVLIVEDREDLRHMIAEALASSGFSIMEACDGREALQLCESQPSRVDLLFTDVVMPHIDGIELANRIVRIRPQIRVLFTSGYELNDEMQKKITQGEIHFLPKPYDVAQVLEKIREVMQA
jgi:CheY-like chemotaxis protein